MTEEITTAVATAATTSTVIADSEVRVGVTTEIVSESEILSSTNKGNDINDDVTTVPNMTTAEQVMINRLVGQNAEVRKFVLEKLEDWLRAIHTWFPKYIQIERESQMVIHVEGNFVRVWKALFCSIWLTTYKKHSPQEALVGPITDYLSIISDEPILLSLFVEQFFVTLIREWTWIDTQRLEFITLIRIFIRKFLQECTNYNWKNEYLEPFVRILTVHVFNHHPPPPRTTRANSKALPPLKTPPEFQIHIARIFLEELETKLKVAARAESSQMLKLASPFVNELAETEDTELMNEINLGIERHLFKNVTIDNVELLGSTLETVGLSDSCNKIEILSVGAEPSEPMQCDEVEDSKTDSKGRQPCDEHSRPQQSNLDYGELILALFRAAAQKSTKTPNRKLVIALAEKFQVYEVKDPNSNTADVLAAENEPVPSKPPLLNFDKMKKYIKIKKLLRDLPKAKEEALNLIHTKSTYLNDPELIDHIGDNYMSYLVEMEQNNMLSSRQAEVSLHSSEPAPKFNSRDTSKTTNTDNANRKLYFETCVLDRQNKGKKKDCEEINNTENGAGEKKMHAEKIETKSEVLITTRKRRLIDLKNSSSSISVVSSDETNTLLHDQDDSIVPLKRKKVVKDNSAEETSLKSFNTVGSTTSVTPVTSPSSSVNQLVVLSPFTPSPYQKEVLFVLAKNLEHEHSDYQDSIIRSPTIPFDGSKRPTSGGLLKSKLPRKPSFWKKRKVAAYQNEVSEITTGETTTLN